MSIGILYESDECSNRRLKEIIIKKGMYYLIDVNATSNFTPDYIPLLGFDPIEKMAGYIIDKYPP